MIEKQKRMIQIYDLYGEILDQSAFLKEREKKIWANIARRREELRQWLEARGMIPKSKQEVKK